MLLCADAYASDSKAMMPASDVSGEMYVVLRDYFTLNRRRVLFDLFVMYAGILIALAAALAQAMIHGQLQHVIRARGTTIALIAVLVPMLLTFSLNFIAACILGRRLARATGQPLGEYVRTSHYEEAGKAVLRRRDGE